MSEQFTPDELARIEGIREKVKDRWYSNNGLDANRGRESTQDAFFLHDLLMTKTKDEAILRPIKELRVRTHDYSPWDSYTQFYLHATALLGALDSLRGQTMHASSSRVEVIRNRLNTRFYVPLPDNDSESGGRRAATEDLLYLASVVEGLGGDSGLVQAVRDHGPYLPRNKDSNTWEHGPRLLAEIDRLSVKKVLDSSEKAQDQKSKKVDIVHQDPNNADRVPYLFYVDGRKSRFEEYWDRKENRFFHNKGSLSAFLESLGVAVENREIPEDQVPPGGYPDTLAELEDHLKNQKKAKIAKEIEDLKKRLAELEKEAANVV